MEKHLLSKSTFIRGVQCLKSLYLNKKRPFLRDKLPKERLLVFRRGHEIGELAHQLFPGGVNMSPGHPSAYRKAVINTAAKIQEGTPVIYEAGFQHDQVLIFLDILVLKPDGWHAYEVKSSRSVSETYLMDAALQYYVIRGSGLNIQSISIIHIDEEYTREEAIDPHRLFTTVNVTDEALSRQEFVRKQIPLEKEALALPHSPKIEVGPHCREPYDCDFIGHCWKKIPKPDARPISELLDLNALRSAREENSGNTAFIRLLSMKQALPRYSGTRPYQEIPYACSLLINGKPYFEIFPAEENPETALRESIIQKLEGIKTIVCLGQEHMIGKILPREITLIDLQKYIPAGSDLLHIDEGNSLLRKLIAIAGLERKKIKYSSDAVCAHEYLENGQQDDTQLDLRTYANAWTYVIEGIFKI